MAIDAASLFETFVQNVESYLLWDKLKTEPHQAGNIHGIIIGDFGATADVYEARKLRAALWIIDNVRAVAEVIQGFDPRPILTIANQIEQDPDNAPAAVRAAWPSVKATLEAATIPQPQDTPAPKGRSGRRPTTKPLARFANTRRNRTPPMAWSEIAVEYLSEHPKATTNATGKSLTWNHVRDAWRRYYGDKKPKQRKRPARKNAQNI